MNSLRIAFAKNFKTQARHLRHKRTEVTHERPQRGARVIEPLSRRGKHFETLLFVKVVRFAIVPRQEEHFAVQGTPKDTRCVDPFEDGLNDNTMKLGKTANRETRCRTRLNLKPLKGVSVCVCGVGGGGGIS